MDESATPPADTGRPDPLEMMGRDSRTGLVRAAVNDSNAQMASWHARGMYGLGAGAQIYRVSGDARTSGGLVPWSAVVKVFTTEGEGLQAASPDPSSWDYWKREWLAYQAPWLNELRGRVVAPRCLGFGEQSDGAACWIAMADLADLDHRPWPLTRFGTVAHDLGAFNGAYVTGQPLPTDPWLATDWIRGWTARADVAAVLSAAAEHPLVRGIFSETMTAKLVGLWNDRDGICAALDSLPPTLCHRDVFPRNAFGQPTGQGDRTVVIDLGFLRTWPGRCRNGAAGGSITDLVRGRRRQRG